MGENPKQREAWQYSQSEFDAGWAIAFAMGRGLALASRDVGGWAALGDGFATFALMLALLWVKRRLLAAYRTRRAV